MGLQVLFIWIRKRDGKERITFCSKYLNEWIFLLLVNENGVWKIEKIEDSDIISATLNKHKSSLDAEDLILFFKNYYYANNNDFSNDL
ncbi:hypothetical protein [Flavobacterium nitrogenifigens]|uniref:Uncharacterized protein n=1 Tax=Flavobacterium nitrogenifigens TaxID=1617283 RepID=A0A521AZ79_9FLAO|nr:hypothetical protein [Flavobacterium nitrogenifigens]KAF2329144.1 hypothetical protein DM397_15820 [Flavobacterium nitrogenifigens]SMO40116.1 hypothetical protein SAMN06265220_101546 [Flavobacterium nitrogenifigens]